MIEILDVLLFISKAKKDGVSQAVIDSAIDILEDISHVQTNHPANKQIN